MSDVLKHSSVSRWIETAKSVIQTSQSAVWDTSSCHAEMVVLSDDVRRTRPVIDSVLASSSPASLRRASSIRLKDQPGVNPADISYTLDCPLAASLYAYMDNSFNVWSCPSKGAVKQMMSSSPVSDEDLLTCRYMEVGLGESTANEIGMFEAFVRRCHAEDQSVCPVPGVAVVVEKIPMRESGFVSLTEWLQNHVAEQSSSPPVLRVSVEPEARSADPGFAARVFFGNGVSWLGVLNLNIYKMEQNDDFLIDCSRPCDVDVLDLESLFQDVIFFSPGDKEILQRSLNCMYSQQFTRNLVIKGSVSVEHLFYLMGSDVLEYHPPSIAVQCFGTLAGAFYVPDLSWLRCKTEDSSLHLSERLPYGYLSLAMEHVKFVYNTQMLASAVVLNTKFPCPETCCKIMKLPQRETFFKLYKSVLTALDSAVLSSHLLAVNAVSKKISLIVESYVSSLDSGRSVQILPYSSPMLRALVEVFKENSMSIRLGGSRYSTAVKYSIVKQFDVFRKSSLLLVPDVSKEGIKNLTFGRRNLSSGKFLKYL